MSGLLKHHCISPPSQALAKVQLDGGENKTYIYIYIYIYTYAYNIYIIYNNIYIIYNNIYIYIYNIYIYIYAKNTCIILVMFKDAGGIQKDVWDFLGSFSNQLSILHEVWDPFFLFNRCLQFRILPSRLLELHSLGEPQDQIGICACLSFEGRETVWESTEFGSEWVNQGGPWKTPMASLLRKALGLQLVNS